MRAPRIPGLALVIVKGDQIVSLKGYGQADSSGRPVTPQTSFMIGSVTKAFTALAVMQLVEAGTVELDAPVQQYIPWFRVAAAHDGRIIKPEGDGFWIVFPSVTAAALAAMTMQEELRLARVGKGDDRLAMRIVLTLGDVLHQEGALVGDAVVLAARIEDITPPDEIYLSTAAWLAVNQAEVRTSFVDAFGLCRKVSCVADMRGVDPIGEEIRPPESRTVWLE